MTPWPNYEVLYYQDVKGNIPARDFLWSLPEKVRAKIYKQIQLLEENGPNLPRPYADVLRNKIRELRVGFGSDEYRLLYFFYGKMAVFTHGFIKKTDRVPDEEIQKAIKLMDDFLVRVRGGGNG